MATYDASPIALTVGGAVREPREAKVAFLGITAPTPPVFGSFSPAAGAVSRTAAVGLTITDVDGFQVVLVWAELADGTLVMVYDGTAFSTAFDAGSSVSGTTTLTLSIQHDAPGWTDDYTLHVRAEDADGAIATTSSAYTLTNPPAAPVFGSFSPAPGAVARADNVDFTVTDPEGFAQILVWAVLGDGSTVMVYDGSTFSGEVNAASSVSGTTTRSFSITYDGDGWTDDYTLHSLAIDAGGASSTASAAYTLSDPPDPPDATVPTVTVVSPTPPGPVGRNDAVRIRVTDAGGLRRVWLFVTMDGEQYVVHNGYSFRAAYSGGSTRTTIADGYEFVVLRTGGWLAAPTFEVQAADEAGNER